MRIRVAIACQPSCPRCAPVGIDDAAALESLLEHAERRGERQIYLFGRALAGAPGLATVTRAARRRGMSTVLVEEGDGRGLPAAARQLQELGIGAVYLTLPTVGGEAPSGAADPRKAALATLAVLRKAGLGSAGVHLPLTRLTGRDLGAVLRLQSRLGITELLVSDASGDWPAPRDWAPVLAALDRVWSAANALDIRLHVVGFEPARYAPPLPPAVPAPAFDGALFDLIRRGVPFPSARAGIRTMGTPGGHTTLRELAGGAEGVRALGLELAAYRCPFVDLPPCLGGVLGTARTDDAAGIRMVKSDACPTCPLDSECPGMPEPRDGDGGAPRRAALRPLPAWPSAGRPPRVLILSPQGGDQVFSASTLPALARALRRRGVAVEIVSPWLSRWDADALPYLPDDVRFAERWHALLAEIHVRRGQPPPDPAAQERPGTRLPRDRAQLDRNAWMPDWQGSSGIEAWLAEHDLGEFDMILAADLPTAQRVLATGSLAPTARVVVLDFHMLMGMDEAVRSWITPPARPADGGWWPTPRLVIESGFPGYVKLYRNYGVPLEQIAWRPYPLYAGHFPPGPPVETCSVIMSGGTHLRDLETLRAATERLPDDVHPLILFDRGEQFAGNAHLLHEGGVPLPSFYHALANSRFVVVPLHEDPHCAAGVTVLAMALMAGRPVVATGIAAVRDYVQHGVEGLLVPPGDAQALADAITRLDRDPDLLAALAAGARAAGRCHSTEHWADQIVSGRPSVPSRTRGGWRPW